MRWRGAATLGTALLFASAASGLLSSSAVTGGSKCVNQMYDFVRTDEAALKKVWGFTPDDKVGDYAATKENCVNNTDFWQIRVFEQQKKPMSMATEWFSEHENCKPFQKEEKQGAQNLKITRNPAEHWRKMMKEAKDNGKVPALVRLALVNQHERDKNKQTTEQRACKGAHATSFYFTEDKVYQLPAAWVNMYTVMDWVKAWNEAGGDGVAVFTWDDFFTSLATLFEPLPDKDLDKTGKSITDAMTKKCKERWTNFKKIFMPPTAYKLRLDMQQWEIPPVFAKLPGHSEITADTTCENADEKGNEWFTEPNKSYQSPYWRDLIFVIHKLPEEQCQNMLKKIIEKAGGKAPSEKDASDAGQSKSDDKAAPKHPKTKFGLRNKGVNCWSACGSGGPCPSFCGAQGACCRKGWADDGCGDRGNFATDCKHHRCVATKTPVGAEARFRAALPCPRPAAGDAEDGDEAPHAHRPGGRPSHASHRHHPHRHQAGEHAGLGLQAPTHHAHPRPMHFHGSHTAHQQLRFRVDSHPHAAVDKTKPHAHAPHGAAAHGRAGSPGGGSHHAEAAQRHVQHSRRPSHAGAHKSYAPSDHSDGYY